MIRLALLLLCCACTVCAQPYTMHVWRKGGSMVSVPVTEVRKLTFAGRLTGLSNDRLAPIVSTFALLQNYPNPFNPSTTIEYELPRAGEVQVRIFNVTGQLIRAFAPLHQASGLHATFWDGKNASGGVVATGMYVYQVAFENSILTKKMLFMK